MHMTNDSGFIHARLWNVTRLALFSSTTQCIQKPCQVVGVETIIQILLILVQGTNEKTQNRMRIL